jgi:hypothetical protein
MDRPGAENMSRIALVLLTGGLLFVVVPGCANSLELNAINEFTKAVEKGDFETLKADSSDEFQAKALRREEAIDDLKLLRLPKGKITIHKIQDVSSTEKLVTVTVGKSKQKTRYKLIRESESGKKWVVDDIIVRQTREGLKVAKSVTEQMDLLSALRDFLDAWGPQGTHAEMLAVTTTEFRDVLADLPPRYLAQLTGRVVDGRQPKSKFRPDIQMDDDVAIATLPGKKGNLVFSCRLEDGNWKVADLAVESKTDGKHIPSVAKMADVGRATGVFLKAYAAGDKPELEKISSKRFFEGSLAPADLRIVPLPSRLDALDDFEVTMRGRRADIIVRGESEVIKFGLARDPNDVDPDTKTGFLVDEVTIYELHGSQEKRLSALFTAHATMQIFSKALRQRNLSMISKTASIDFKKRVWQHVDGSLLAHLPLGELEDARPRVLSTTFEGAVTEITVMQGTRALTYVLRDEGGHMRVDDVHVPAMNRPTSLKTTLALLLPIRDFIAGIDSGNIERLQRISSEDLNRLVWRQTDTIPQAGYVVPRHLQAELSAVKIGKDEAMIVLGDARFGSHVRLKREYGRYVVDEVLLIAGPESSQRAPMKRAMRLELAARGLQTMQTRVAAKPQSLIDASAAAGSSRPADRPADATDGTSSPPPDVAPVDETFGAVLEPGSMPVSKPNAN